MGGLVPFWNMTGQQEQEQQQMLSALQSGDYHSAATHANMQWLNAVNASNSAVHTSAALTNATWAARLANAVPLAIPDRISTKEYVVAALLDAFDWHPGIVAAVGEGPFRLERVSALDEFRAETYVRHENALVAVLRFVALGFNQWADWLAG